ncbi:MAG TPA: hypothetical protein VHE57_13500 [Mycobacteriales bacterium]|nr:hypothetical protein [Mycobacteriales bacterium]
MRRLWLVALVAAAGCVLVPASAPAAPAATQVLTVSPVSDNGHLLPGYKVVKRLPGAKCTPRSVVTGNAYKCVSHFTYDPCWLTAKHGYVDCLASPYQRKVTRLHVTRGYNKGGPGAAKKLPWGLRLTTGVKTTVIPGKFGEVQGRKINYSYHNFQTVLYGPIDKSEPLWRIRRARDDGRFHFKPAGWVTIARAWFGAPTRLG